MESREHRGGIVGPVILIGLGVIFLLNNLGWLEWGVWETVLRLWPVLLIGAGLDLLIGRRSAWGSLLVAIVLLGILAGAIWFRQVRPDGPSASAEAVEQALQGADQARIEIDPGVGQLQLGVLDQPGLLLAGRVDLDSGERLVTESDLSGGRLTYSLSSDKTEWAFWGPWGIDRDWQIQLTPEIPIELIINTGVGEAVIDLSRLSVPELTVSTGVGRTVLTLPRSGDVSAEIDGGVGQLVVRIPQGAAARIDANGGLAPISASPGFEHRGDLYFTPAYEDADDRLEVRVELGVGSLQLEIAP